ncbi:MAG TPA: endo-1,3-alpha-glucanase family glycosylhydrolase [Armatimonadota bacterium]|jgi:hypothetical protein
MSLLLGRAGVCLALLVLIAVSATVARTAEANTATPKRYVFANYCVCFASYGETLDGYKREIREAQAAGIDGFVLDCGAWSNEPHYPRRVKMMLQAAQELGTDFKYFFEFYGGFSKVEYLFDAIKTYGKHPNYFTYQGRIVVSTWGMDDVAWKKDVLDPLKQDGYDVYFVPAFYARPNGQAIEQPTYAMQKENVTKWADLVDGMFFWGAAGTAEQMSASNSATTKALHEAKKLSMASVSPVYWGSQQFPQRRYFETRGGEGTAMQWAAILQAQPEWLELLTWNDWMESTYLCPVEDPAKYFGQLTELRRYPHAGYLALNRYYIAWYKTGKQPPISKDSLYFFYRTHPKDAVAPDDKPVLSQYGEIADVIYVTTLLTKPAELRVVSGANAVCIMKVPAGINHVRVPFAVGAQHFELYRGDKALISKDGDPILDKITKYNFFPTSGFAEAQ